MITLKIIILFFFNKPKTTLKDLIPDNHIDIHSHLLAAVDDGAKNINDTIYLINELHKIGFANFITTPHINGFWKNTKEKIEKVKSETIFSLNKNNINFSIKAAAEYLIDDHLVSLFIKKEILTLKGNYVLVEISYINPPINLYEILFDLQIAGYTPILAHPERYSFYHKNFNEYKKLKNAGCLFQLNLLSIVGYYGSEVTEVANKLLKNGFIDFVGSDVHHKKHIEAFNSKTLLKDHTRLKEAIANNNMIFK